ncbi:MAG: GTP cyclohydrolase I FolE2 [Proteobacteria bacterium]|nr:GTP cyclohydrolase I FolE2 [Desulfobulbaceae bacterium]MBU4151360.1 GTP cyclohydrolase I FolE2 [Pseudomonadota bacterium]
MKLTNVGIENIRHPIHVLEKSGGHQQTVASIRMQANMPRQHRGTCLSTFMSILSVYQDDIRTEIFPRLLTDLRNELQADSASIEMTFPYFIEKRAPVTGTPSLMEYTCVFACGVGGCADLQVSILVPSTTLCPCSKEISRFGAHNQRAEIDFAVKFINFIWIEDLIALVESAASCEVYSLLKRPDEKYVTEKAYENPMFVEDVVRKIAVLARQHPDIGWFSVGVESFESIHKHSAYAYTDSATM